MSGRFEPHVLQFLVIHLRLSEQNVPSMDILLTLFGCFAPIVLGFFTDFPIPLSLLRFEANFLFMPFRS